MTITPQNVIEEQDRLKSERDRYDKLKILCTQLAYPMRSDQWDSFGIDEGSARRGKKIYDSTAIRALEIWGNGIIGHYMPREINWFAEQMADRKLNDLKRVRLWLQETDEHMRFVTAESNYYEQKLVTVMDAGGIGDSYLYIDKDDESGKQMMVAPHPREFYICRDFWGRIRHLHHKFEKTLRQVADEFGDDALSESQQTTLKTSPNSRIEIIRGVYKNSDYEPGRAGVKYMRWLHVYVNVAAKKNMLEGGSQTLNPIPWSLNRPSHEQYGRGIVAQMLVEILMANLMGKSNLMAAQYASEGSPMLMTSGLKHKLNLNPRAVTFVKSAEMQGLKMGDLVTRLIDTSGYPFGKDNHEKWQEMVSDRFGVSLFLALNMAGANGYKNIAHIQAAQAERAVLMGPFLGTLGTTTDMEFDRMYAIEVEPGYDGGRWRGRAPEPPPEVLDAAKGRIDIQYIGPLAQLLKQYYETGSLLSTIQNIKAVLEVPQFADSAGIIKDDELMRKILRSSNAPEDMIYTPEEAAEIRAMAAEAQEQQRQIELMKNAAGSIPDMSKKIESDSVLSALTA